MQAFLLLLNFPSCLFPLPSRGLSGLDLPFLIWTQHNPLCGCEGHTVKIMSILASQAYIQNLLVQLYFNPSDSPSPHPTPA